MTSADRATALRKLNTEFARRNWNNAGHFNVPGAVMRALVEEGYAEMRKRHGSAPAEYRSRTLLSPREASALEFLEEGR